MLRRIACVIVLAFGTMCFPHVAESQSTVVASPSHRLDKQFDDASFEAATKSFAMRMSDGSSEYAISSSPTPGGPTPDDMRAAFATTHQKGAAAYTAYIVGKSDAEKASAKKLYAAWLTYIDSLHESGKDVDSDRSPAKLAYVQAVNEYKIDVGATGGD